jgi:hypothetical protein
MSIIVQNFENLQNVNADNMNLFYKEKDQFVESFFNNVPCICSGIGTIINSFGQVGTTNQFNLLDGFVRAVDQQLFPSATNQTMFAEVSANSYTITVPSDSTQYYVVVTINNNTLVSGKQASLTTTVETTAILIGALTSNQVVLFGIEKVGAVYTINIDNNCAYNYSVLITETNLNENILPAHLASLIVSGQTTLANTTINGQLNGNTVLNSWNLSGTFSNVNTSALSSGSLFFEQNGDISTNTLSAMQTFVQSGTETGYAGTQLQIIRNLSGATINGAVNFRWDTFTHKIPIASMGVNYQDGIPLSSASFSILKNNDQGSDIDIVGYYQSMDNQFNNGEAVHEGYFNSTANSMQVSLYASNTLDNSDNSQSGIQCIAGERASLVGNIAILTNSITTFTCFNDFLFADHTDESSMSIPMVNTTSGNSINNFIIKAGSLLATDGMTVTYDTPFPTATKSVVATPDNTNSGVNINVQVLGPDSFKIWISTSGITVNWVAVGT